MGELRRFAPAGLEGGVTAWVEPAEPFTELVASWAAATPPGSHIAVFVQARTVDRQTAWLGRNGDGPAAACAVVAAHDGGLVSPVAPVIPGHRARPC